MDEKNLRSLDLHTLDSLCADLISARPVGVGKKNSPFLLDSEAARAILNWYYGHKGKWAGNVMAPDVEAMVDCTSTVPPDIPEVVRASLHAQKRYVLISMRVHQFGGLHHPGSINGKPDDFYFAFGRDATMFEGFNGCGKTSLLNAIIWTLTGEVLRPQRPPEPANKEFTCEIDGASKHTLSPVMPLPDPSVEKPNSQALPVDTWVELIFEDESKTRYSVRRTQKRTNRGTLQEDISGLEALGLDPVGGRVGTVMPGLLPFIQVGSESKLGKAVSELTGMAPLINLASHAERAKKKIDGDLTKDRNLEIEDIDVAYRRSQADLVEIIMKHPPITFAKTIPGPSGDTAIEATLDEAMEHFDGLRARGLIDAKLVLGETFDPDVAAQRTDLETSIQPAVIALKSISNLPSTARLSALGKLTDEDLRKVQERIKLIFEEADALAEIASYPDRAGRIRLYARVAAWIKEHATLAVNDEVCAVCGHDLQDAVDPVTGTQVKKHLQDAAMANTDFLSQTFTAWSKHVLAELSHELPAALAQEMKTDLPDHPGRLVRAALIDELFEGEAFQNTLALLKPDFQAMCDAAIFAFPIMEIAPQRQLGSGQKELAALSTALMRISKCVAFSAWRNANKSSLVNFMQSVVGQAETPENETVSASLLGRLTRLHAMVDAIEPVRHAMTLCKRMKADVARRRLKDKRLAAYVVASDALSECMKVGTLAEQQVEQLQHRLHKSAVNWRSKIYSSAFPSTSLDLVATKMSGDGELQLMVGGAGLAAPAQHFSNASALRASLVGFFLAYWEHMLTERGGLRLLLLDDPQELLDGDNREKLADAIEDLHKAGAQLILTTHDGRFAASVAKRAQGAKIGIDHQYVHPATRLRGTIYPSPSISKVQLAHDEYQSDPDDPTKAQEYASECRIFIEGRIGDIFDDVAFPTVATLNFAPSFSDHLSRLRGLQKSGSNELFRSPLLAAFCNDPALKDRALPLSLLNKAHHSPKATIRPMDVNAVVKDLERVRRSVERVHEEFRLFRRRERLIPPTADIPPLERNAIPSFKVFIQPSLAAFVRGAAVGDSQETEFEEISSDWFAHKAFFYLRSSNLGFAGPISSVAIAEVEPSQVEDRRLVIARRGQNIYARRVLRPSDSDMVALAAETPDPRSSPQTLLVHENEVSLHRVVGMLFDANVAPPVSKKEAVQIDGAGILPRVQRAYRIKEESAIPLALPGQIALGGASISVEEFDKLIDAYVALHLDDGSSIFKRVGEKLPAPLSHLRRFETIGGLGVADILSVGGPQAGFRVVVQAVHVLGVLYHL